MEAPRSIENPLMAHEYRMRLASEIELYGESYQDETIRFVHDEIAIALGRALRSVSLVLWTDELRIAAVQGAELFLGKSVSAALLRPPSQFWMFEKDLGISKEVRLERGLEDGYGLYGVFALSPEGLVRASDARSVHDVVGDGAVFWTYLALSHRDSGPGLPPKLFHTLTNDKHSGPAEARVAALLHFMNLEITHLHRARLPRQVRRRMGREAQPEPDIRVFSLRRTKADHDGQGDPVNWSCRWIVGGHWRNQWHPSAQEHKPVYIVPYVKGPDDKPLKADSAPKIYHVRR